MEKDGIEQIYEYRNILYKKNNLFRQITLIFLESNGMVRFHDFQIHLTATAKYLYHDGSHKLIYIVKAKKVAQVIFRPGQLYQINV
jgi:hypothetical protein